MPGVCIHAVPVSRRPGSGDLHLEIDPFPSNLIFKPLPGQELLDLDVAEESITPPRPPLRPPPPPPKLTTMPSAHSTASIAKPGGLEECAKLISEDKAFENTSTSVAASQMRNALTALADTCKDPEEREVRHCLASTICQMD